MISFFFWWKMMREVCLRAFFVDEIQIHQKIIDYATVATFNDKYKFKVPVRTGRALAHNPLNHAWDVLSHT